jgi:pantoate--beta-alanine ligase
MEGKFRPGHFDGVGTIVKRLFEIVTLQMLILRKDFQQLQIVKKMVSKNKLKVNVIGCDI